MSTLTPRQEEVVALIASGTATSDKALADALGVRVTTVKSHLARIYRLAHVKGRVNLVTWAANRTRQEARFAALRDLPAASPSGHHEACACSVCYVHRVVEPREARERSRRVA